MPIAEYEQTVKRVNVGYELVLTLAHCFLRALRRPNLRLLVVGAGGGAEIERFLPVNPGWHLTGVDPSQEMLAQAQAKAEALGVAERVRLVRGTVDDVPPGAHFEAATCLFVLHFLPDQAKLALLQAVAARRHADAPLLVASGGLVQVDAALRQDLLGAWQEYGELAGMPAERMAGTIQEIMTQQVRATAEQGYVRLLHEAGYPHVASVLSVMAGGLQTWVAR